MKNILFTILCVALLVTGCTTTVDPWESLDSEDYSFSVYSGDFMFEDYDNYCALYMDAGSGMGIDEEYVINSDEDYQDLLAIMDEYGCEWFQGTTEIDFDQYTLLGNWASGTGCTVDFQKDVQINHDEQKVIYTVTVDDGDSDEIACDMWSGSQNWILVEKIPDDYTVDFVVEN